MKKYILLCTLFASAHLPAQQTRWMVLPADTITSKKIKSIKEIVLFMPVKDGAKEDTGSVNIQYYNTKGRVDSMNYSSALDKNRYREHIAYTYNDTGWIMSQIVNASDNYFDSISYANPSMTVAHSKFWSYKYHYYWENDSTWVEKRIEKNDTTLHRHRYYKGRHYTAFDYEYEFASGKGFDALNTKKVITHDPVNGYDSCRFYDNKGNLAMMIVHKNDSLNGKFQIEYFNYNMSNTFGFMMSLNSYRSMTDHMPISKNGKPSYIVNYTNTPNRLSSETAYHSAKKHYTPVVVRYVYEYY